MTATISAAPSPTEIVETRTPLPDISATEHWVTSTAIVESILASQQPRLYESYASPDAKWLAEVLIYDCAKTDANPDADENAYEQLKLTNVGSGDEEIIDSQLQNCGGLGAAGLDGLFWSPNSHYFYYTDAREGVPDGCGGFWHKPVFRLDTNTRMSELLGGGPVSPDGTKVAAWQENELIIWDVNEGNETGRISPITLNSESATGPIVWSPDSQALVYIQTESFCPVSGNSSVIYVDLSTLEQEILLESESPTFGSGDWDEKNELILFDADGNQWAYTLDTQNLEPLP